MIVLLLILLLAAGGILLLAGSRSLPSLREWKLIRALGKPSRRSWSFERSVVMPFAYRLARYVRLPNGYRADMQKTLTAAGYTMTPETYVARTAVAVGLFLLLALLCLVTGLNLPAAGFLVTAVILGIQTQGEARARLRKRSRRLAGELPQFMRTISQTLRYNRDLLGIVKQYRYVAGPELRAELDILVTDMQTSNQEQALIRFADRLRIDDLTTFVNGLVSESKGYDQVEFLRSTERDMRKTSLERLKTEAKRKSGQVERAGWLLVAVIAAVWIVAIAYTSLSGFTSISQF